MAARVVLLGWADTENLELDALDAELLVKDKILRVSFSLCWKGLENAIVLLPHKKALGSTYENCTQGQYDAVIERVKRLCPRARTVPNTFAHSADPDLP